jgi:hypothetical protein
MFSCICMPMRIDVCSIDVLLHGKAHTHTCHTCARTDTTREGAAMAARVCLTVSSLLPPAGLCSPATDCRCCQPTYLPDLHRFSECICVTWLLTESRSRVRVCISFVRLLKCSMRANSLCTPRSYVYNFSYKVYTRITSYAYYCICMSTSVDVCSIDVLFHGESKHTHLSHVRSH